MISCGSRGIAWLLSSRLSMGGTFIAPTVEGKKEWHLLAQWNPLVAHCLICIDKTLQHNDILNAKMDGIDECEFGVFYIYP